MLANWLHKIYRIYSLFRVCRIHRIYRIYSNYMIYRIYSIYRGYSKDRDTPNSGTCLHLDSAKIVGQMKSN